jgi:hypothetical protein
MANQIARKLRKTLTPQEVKIWVHLRSWRQRGFHFRRQSPRQGYIVDFVCLKHRLVVETVGNTIWMLLPLAMHVVTKRSASPAFAFFDFGIPMSITILRASYKRSTQH